MPDWVLNMGMRHLYKQQQQQQCANTVVNQGCEVGCDKQQGCVGGVAELVPDWVMHMEVRHVCTQQQQQFANTGDCGRNSLLEAGCDMQQEVSVKHTAHAWLREQVCHRHSRVTAQQARFLI
jgi:hypothetical protein